MNLELLSYQQAVFDQIVLRCTSSASGAPVLFLRGKRGVGKKTIIKKFCADYEIQYIEISLSSDTQIVGRSITETLVSALSDTPDGYAVLVHFVNFEFATDGIFPFFSDIVKARRISEPYFDIGHDVVLAFSMSTDVLEAGVDFSSTYFSLFVKVYDVFSSYSDVDIEYLCRYVSNECCRNFNFLEESISVLKELIESNSGEIDYLINLINNLSLADCAVSDISADLLVRVATKNLNFYIKDLQYRGVSLTYDAIIRWINQFPDELKACSYNIIKLIATKYFIGSNRYYSSLEDLKKKSGLTSGSRVVFCKWQPMGSSSPRVAHDLKNYLNLKRYKDDLDIMNSIQPWPEINPEYSTFLIVDDFIGSGKTLSALFSGDPSPVSRVLRKYPTCVIYILIIAGYESSISSIRQIISMNDELRNRVEFRFSILLNDGDKCFSSSSIIVPEASTRETLKEFLGNVRETHYKFLPKNFTCGFNDIGSCVVFFDTVPNNSLPLLWVTGSTWYSLFPASGAWK